MKLLILTIILFMSSPVLAGEYLLFNTSKMRLPYYDNHGVTLKKIEDRVTVYGGGRIHPLDWLSPSIANLDEWEFDDEILLYLDITSEEADAIVTLETMKTYEISYRIKKRNRNRYLSSQSKLYKFKDYKSKRLTLDEAEMKLQSWGIIK